MKKFSLGNIVDMLFMMDIYCPDVMYEELIEFQCDCEKMDNCFECWYRTIATYQSEQSLKSMNDSESEDK